MAENRVVLARHGETEWSRNGRHTGTTDIPLTAKGEDQARALAPLLGGHDFELVLSSPMRRARATAALAGFGDRIEIDEDLVEWDYGEYEGRTTTDIRTEAPGWTIWDGVTPGGETADRVAARADRVIARCKAAPGDVLLFGHGHALRVLGARWCELSPLEGRRLVLGTGTVCRLGWEHDAPGIEAWNAPGLPG